MSDTELKHKEGDSVDLEKDDCSRQSSGAATNGHVGTKKKEKKKTRHGIELVPQPSDDPRDPLNWSMTKKLTIFALVCYATFVGIATAVANVLATPNQAESWGVTPTQATYSISAVLAGIILGPVLLVPIVRVIGVMSCIFWSSVLIALTSVWSATATGGPGTSNSYASFIASRAVAGLFCGTAQVFAAGIVAQVFFLHQRGKALAVYGTVYMVATVAGPTFSGFVVQDVGWPVAFWWTVAANGLAAGLFLMLADDTAWDRVRDGPPAGDRVVPRSWAGKRVALFLPGTRVVPKGKARSIKTSLDACWRIALSPVAILAGVYSMICFAWFIMAGVQIPIILEQPVEAGGYGFDPQSTAFFYFSAWIGALAGVAYGVLVNDRLPLWLQKRSGVWHPEYRLQTAWIPGLVVGPIGSGLFGAANYYHMHWIVMAVGECFLVFGATASVPPSINYVIEVFKSHPQEVGTVLNVFRITFSISVQFFYEPWVRSVGVNWVWGTASFINLFAFALVGLLLWKGAELRQLSMLPDESDDLEKPDDDKTP